MVDVNDWTVGDVTQWLNSVMLGQYASTFAANEITGPILLDISLEGNVVFTSFFLYISATHLKLSRLVPLSHDRFGLHGCINPGASKSCFERDRGFASK
jgi:hypothetical protein